MTARPARGFLSLFAVLSLASVVLGCVVARANGAQTGEWARNLAAWSAGAFAAAALARWAGIRLLWGFAIAAPLGLAASLLSVGQQGVHRWIDLGPMHMNAAEVLLPPAVVAWSALAHGSRWPRLVAVLALAMLIVQPDASQTTALAGALICATALTPGRSALRGGGMLFCVAAVMLGWYRRDPLAPVPDVEGIMGLAWGLSPILAVLAWSTLAGASLAPLVMSRANDRSVRAAAVALAAYALLSVLTPLVGAFPVPLMGMGMSPILGLWLGAGLLAALSRGPRGAVTRGEQPGLAPGLPSP